MTDSEDRDLHKFHDDGNPNHEEDRQMQSSNEPVKPLFGHDHARWAAEASLVDGSQPDQSQMWAARYRALTDLAARKIAALRCVVEIADNARCAFEMANGPSYDSADPVQKAMGDLMEAIVALAMQGE